MSKIKAFIKKHWKNLLFFIAIIIFLVPQTRFPIQVSLQRLLSFAPQSYNQDNIMVKLDGWKLKSTDTVKLPETIPKPKLINFWATWCPPCVAEMPSFQRLYDDYSDDIEFLFISDEDFELTHKFAEQYNYSLPFYQPENKRPTQLEGNQLPTTYLIDKEGKLILKHTGSADWNADSFREKLDSLLLK